MEVTIENNVLVIRVPMGDPTPSKSGKTLVVNGQPVVVGLNAYIKR